MKTVQSSHKPFISAFGWVLLSYHNEETIVFTIDPQYGFRNGLINNTPFCAFGALMLGSHVSTILMTRAAGL